MLLIHKVFLLLPHCDECPKHSSYTHVRSPFRFISSSNKCVYRHISDTRILCISSEKCGIWKLCRDLKKEIKGELSLNVATLSLYDVQPTSANVATLRCRQDSPNKNFLDITKRTKKKRGRRKGIRDGEDNTRRFERSCNPCTCIFSLELILIKTE